MRSERKMGVPRTWPLNRRRRALEREIRKIEKLPEGVKAQYKKDRLIYLNRELGRVVAKMTREALADGN